MQTFLPLPDYKESARVLDKQRLFKQGVEGLQIMQALCQRRLVSSVPHTGPRGGRIKLPLLREDWYIENTAVGWRNHPATKMWADSQEQLFAYISEIHFELEARSMNNGQIGLKARLVLEDAAPIMKTDGTPKWWGVEGFHESHRSNLLRKAPEWYSQFGWMERNDLPYVWPA